jgi:hypothetical protein
MQARKNNLRIILSSKRSGSKSSHLRPVDQLRMLDGLVLRNPLELRRLMISSREEFSRSVWLMSKMGRKMSEISLRKSNCM